MRSLIHQALSGSRQYLVSGALHTLGAMPLRQTDNVLEMSFLGKKVSLFNDAVLPGISQGSPAGNFDKLVVAGSALMTVGSIGMGFAEGGLLGAVRREVTDIGVDAALLRHAYHRVEEAGVTTSFSQGRLNPSMLKKMGMGRMAGGLGTLDFLFRMGVGSHMAYSFGDALGGGIVGTGAALIGGSLGVRHAGKLAAVAGSYYLGRTAARGTYEVFKNGYNHFQAQKAIQTSGDMSAFMTQGAFTMRARASQVMGRSQENIRMALGREGTTMHQSQRGYNRYRTGAY